MAALTPGPAVLLTLKNGALYGFKMSCVGILGNISAVFFLALLSVMGLGVLLTSLSNLLLGLKIIGGAYLLYLGVRSWSSTAHGIRADDIILKTPTSNPLKLYSEAFIVGISNPKAILFFTALFPQFIEPTQNTISALLPLAIGSSACSCIALMLYGSLSSFFSKRAQKQLQGSKLTYCFNRVIGSIFIVFGLILLTDAIQTNL